MCLRGVIEQSRPFYANARRCIGGADGGVGSVWSPGVFYCLCRPLRGRARSHRFSTGHGQSGIPVGAGMPAKGPAQQTKSSDFTLFALAPRQPAPVTLLGQARGPGGFHAEATAAGRLLLNHLGRLGSRRRSTDNLCSRLARRNDLSHGNCRRCCRLGGLAQFSQRGGLALGGGSRVRFDQRTLARLAGYVLGHGSADKGLTAAPTGGIEAIGGKVSNQNRTSPMRCHVKRALFSHRLQGLAEPPGRHHRSHWLALCHNPRHASSFRVSGLIVRHRGLATRHRHTPCMIHPCHRQPNRRINA